MDKRFALVFVLVLVASSLIMVRSDYASAQSTTPTPLPVAPSSSPASSPTPTPTPTLPTPTPFIPKPAVPEFTVKLISSLPEANETTVELMIKNQPFDKNNTDHYSFVYNVRISTDGENWTDLYNAEDGYPNQSDSDYTVLSYVLGESAYYPSENYPLAPSMKVGVLPTSGQVAFQVEAMIGHRDRGVYSNGVMPYVFKGETSGWSSAQALNLSDAPTPSPSPTEPFPTAFVVAALVVAVVACAGLLVYFKKREREAEHA